MALPVFITLIQLPRTEWTESIPAILSHQAKCRQRVHRQWVQGTMHSIRWGLYFGITIYAGLFRITFVEGIGCICAVYGLHLSGRTFNLFGVTSSQIKLLIGSIAIFQHL